MVWATYLGGKGADGAHAIALDASGQCLAQRDDRFGGLSESDRLVAGQRFRDRTECRGFHADLQFAPARRYRCRKSRGGRRRYVAHLPGTAAWFRRSRPRRAVRRRASSGLPTRRSARSAGASSPGEVISIYGPRLGPATPVTAVPDASGMMPRSLGGVQVSVNGSPVPLALRVGYAGERGDAAVPFGRDGARACQLQRRGYAPTSWRPWWTAIPEIFQRWRRHGGGRQSGWQHQFAGASGATGKHRCHLGHGNRINAFRRLAGRPDRDGAPSDFGCCQIFAQGGSSQRAVRRRSARNCRGCGAGQLSRSSSVFEFPARYGRCESRRRRGCIPPGASLHFSADGRRKNGYSNLVRRPL